MPEVEIKGEPEIKGVIRGLSTVGAHNDDMMTGTSVGPKKVKGKENGEKGARPWIRA